MTAVRILYNLAFPFVLLALLPGFLFRMLKRGKYRHKFGQRFAIYSPRVRQKLSRGGWTWVHAVSVGEVLIALKLIREMKNRDPQLPVVLSTTTSTGFALASREQGENFETIYNPIDFFWTARRAVRLIRPRRLILVEAEVWPNLTAEAKARGATLALVNARLSSRSESRYRMIRPLASAIFNQLDLLCVQEPADAKRWESLGVDARKILCTGSIKFDDQGEDSRVRRNFRQTLAELGVGESAPIILAGSTHSGRGTSDRRDCDPAETRFPKHFLRSGPTARRALEGSARTIGSTRAPGGAPQWRTTRPRECRYSPGEYHRRASRLV